MTVVYRLTGYNKRTEWLEREYDVPDAVLPQAKAIAMVPPTDAGGSYELDEHQACAIAQLLRVSIDIDGYIWGLEPFAEDAFPA
jgi:hypothetical protein